MQVTFYENKSDPRVLNKNIMVLRTIDNVYLKDEQNFENPTIILQISDTLWEFANNTNYVYIPSFNRFYFIRSKNVIDGNRFEFVLHDDVLSSLKADIIKCNVIVNRGSQHSNILLNDGVVNPYVQSTRIQREFSASEWQNPTLVTNSVILTTIGG